MDTNNILEKLDNLEREANKFAKIKNLQVDTVKEIIDTNTRDRLKVRAIQILNKGMPFDVLVEEGISARELANNLLKEAFDDKISAEVGNG